MPIAAREVRILKRIPVQGIDRIYIEGYVC